MRVRNGERRQVTLPSGVEVLAGIQVTTSREQAGIGAPTHEIAYFAKAGAPNVREGDVIRAGDTQYKVVELRAKERGSNIRRAFVRAL